MRVGCQSKHIVGGSARVLARSRLPCRRIVVVVVVGACKRCTEARARAVKRVRRFKNSKRPHAARTTIERPTIERPTIERTTTTTRIFPTARCREKPCAACPPAVRRLDDQFVLRSRRVSIELSSSPSTSRCSSATTERARPPARPREPVVRI